MAATVLHLVARTSLHESCSFKCLKRRISVARRFVECITRGLACPTQLIFLINFHRAKRPVINMPNLTSEESSEFRKHFGECAEKHCHSWELNAGPSAFRAEALPTELSGQLIFQCTQCPSVLLVSKSQV